MQLVNSSRIEKASIKNCKTIVVTDAALCIKKINALRIKEGAKIAEKRDISQNVADQNHQTVT